MLLAAAVAGKRTAYTLFPVVGVKLLLLNLVLADVLAGTLTEAILAEVVTLYRMGA
jgi:hypothetical protein